MTAADRFAEAMEAAEMMFAGMLRTYVLRAVLCVLLGIGLGFGWHYFVDRAGGRAAGSRNGAACNFRSPSISPRVPE
jgi:hypothetical protein